MHKQIECPPASLLEEFVGGRLIDPELSGLSQHLEDCASCQEKAKTLSPHDTLVEALRGKSVSADAIAGDIPRPLVEKLKHLSQQNSEATSDTIGVGVDASPASRDGELNFLDAAQQPDEIGRLGTYRILKVLGKGGMGVVFLADDPKLDRLVALKVMLPKIASNPSAKDRFLREARAAAKLKSDHIVTIYQVDEVNGIPFLAMELLDGQPLDDFIRDGQSLSVEQIIRIVRDVAKGLAVAHEKGLIHRDIKPANLWLETKDEGGRMKDEKNESSFIPHPSSFRVKILDFGLARSQKDDVHLTQSGTIVGTPAFMAPEQAHGDRSVDARADLFSLGCVLYRLCVGDIPFKSETTMGMLLAIATKHPAAPVDSNTKIPLALSELTMQLLEKDPARRPASAKEVIARLNEIERSTSIRAGQAEVAQLAPTPATSVIAATITKTGDITPSRVRPGLGWLIAPVIALLLLGGGAFGIYQLFFDTPNGRIVVQLEGEDVEARFKNGEITIVSDKDGKPIFTLQTEGQKMLPTGNYGVIVKGAGEPRIKIEVDGVAADVGNKFELKRNGKVIVRIGLEPLLAVEKKKTVEIKQVKDVPPAKGKFALEFDGKSVVDIPSLSRDDNSPITVESFVTIDNVRGPVIARIFGAGGCQLYGWPNTEMNPRWIPNAIDAGGKFLGDAPGLEPNRRYHLAMQLDGTRAEIFLDGKKIREEKRNPGTFNDQIRGTVLGADSANGRNGLIGKLDNLRISKGFRYSTDFTPATRFAPGKGTIALYHFDEGAGDVLTDSSGNGHHGKIVGAKWVKADGTPIPVSTPGKYALQFPGAWTVRVTGLNIPLDPSKPYTVEGYVTAADWTGDMINLPGVGLSISSEQGWVLAQLWNRKNGWVAVTARKHPDQGSRVHVAGVYTGNEGHLYVNGKLVGKQRVVSVAPGPETDDKRTSLGGFRGMIHKVRISQSVRYQADFSPPGRFETDKDTLALYQFDEGAGEILMDSSGNGHHGKIVGAKWVNADGTPISAVPIARNALRFGVAESVNISSLTVPMTGPVTFEAYVTPTEDTYSNNWASVVEANGRMALVIQPNPTQWAFGGNQKSTFSTIKAPGVVKGKRIHLAGVRTENTHRLFVDGVLVAEGKAFELFDRMQPFSLGGKDFSGLIDQVHVSKVARYAKDFTPAQRFEKDADTLALYHFDEGQGDVLADSSGNGHHGKIVGAKWVRMQNSANPPRGDYALEFDGVGNYVHIPTLRRDDSRSLTLEVYVIPAKVDIPFQQIVCMKGSLYARLGQTFNYFGGFVQTNDGLVGVHNSSRTTNPGERWHVAIVWNEKELRYFLDGRLLARTPSWSKIVPHSDGTFIGSMGFDLKNNLRYPFTGIVDELHISKVARYDKDFTPQKRFEPDADTLALYHFDEGQGDKLTDSSGNGHHGKIVGAKWVKADGAAFGPFEFFNGKDLTGWEGLIDQYWSVKDGAIVGTIPKEGLMRSTYLFTKKEYKDFELSCQVKITPSTEKTGVQIRSMIHNHQTFGVRGPRGDMGVSNWGSLYGELFGGMMKAADEKLVAKILKANDFNDYSIKCVGKHVTIKLNGITTVDDDFPNMYPKGIIALQLPAGGPMEAIFRNIRFEDLGLKAKGLPIARSPIITAGTPKLLTTLKAPSAVTKLAFSADADEPRILIAALNQQLAYFDLGKKVPATPELFGIDAVSTIATSADGKTLVYCGIEGKTFITRLMKLPDRRIIGGFTTPQMVQSIALSPDGKTVVFDDGTGLTFRDGPFGKSVNVNTTLPNQRFVGIKFSPDGQFVATIFVDLRDLKNQVTRLVIFDAATRKAIVAKDAPDLSEWTDISSDSKRLVVRGKVDGAPVCYLFSLPNLELVNTLMYQTGPPISGAFSPDGAYLATGHNDGTVQILHIESKKKVLSWNTNPPGEQKPALHVHAVVFSPDGKTLATTRTTGEIHLWDLTTSNVPSALITASAPRLLTTLKNPGGASKLAFSEWENQPRSLIASGDQALTFFDLRMDNPTNRKISGKVLHQEKLSVLSALSTSGDGKSLVYSGIDGKSFVTRVLELPSRNKVYEFVNKQIVLSAALSPDGKTLIYDEGEGLYFRDLLTGKLASPSAVNPGQRYVGLKYSPDGRFVSSVLIDNRKLKKQVTRLVIFNAKTYAQLSEKEVKDSSDWTDISSDSKWIVVGAKKDGKPVWHLFNLPGGELVHTQELPAHCTSGAFSPVGNNLALGLLDGQVQIWDAGTKKLVLSWITNQQVDPKRVPAIHAVAFSPDGKSLATTSPTGEIHQWDLTWTVDPRKR